MKLSVKIVLVLIAILLITALITAVGLGITFYMAFRPYIKYPDVDKVALQAQVDRYEALYKESVDVPKQDSIRLKALLDQVNKNEIDKEYLEDFCDEKELEKLKHHHHQNPDFESYLTQFKSIVDDGLTLHLEEIDPLGFRPEGINFKAFRYFNYRLCELAVAALLAGDSAKARQHLITSIKAMYGAYETPLLINNMIAVALNKKIAMSLIYIAPKMKAEDLILLKAILTRRPDPIVQLVSSYRTEALSSTKVMDQLMEDRSSEEMEKLKNDHDVIFYNISKLFQVSKTYAKLEKLILMDFYVSLINDYENWLNNRNDPIPSGREIDYKIPGILAGIMVPNLERLTKNILEAEALNVAVIRALEMELKRRKAEIKEPFVVEAGTYGKIEMGLDHGCIRKIENTNN